MRYTYHLPKEYIESVETLVKCVSEPEFCMNYDIMFGNSKILNVRELKYFLNRFYQYHSCTYWKQQCDSDFSDYEWIFPLLKNSNIFKRLYTKSIHNFIFNQYRSCSVRWKMRDAIKDILRDSEQNEI